MGRACRTHGETQNAHRILLGKARKKETTRKTRLWWKDNIKMDLRVIEWGGMDWTHLAQDRDQ
jgi:hypothetical protein